MKIKMQFEVKVYNDHKMQDWHYEVKEIVHECDLTRVAVITYTMPLRKRRGTDTIIAEQHVGLTLTNNTTMDNNLQEALNAVQKLKGMSVSQYRREAHHNYQSYGRFEDILHQYQYDAEADYIHSFYMEGYHWEEYDCDCL